MLVVKVLVVDVGSVVGWFWWLVLGGVCGGCCVLG